MRFIHVPDYGLINPEQVVDVRVFEATPSYEVTDEQDEDFGRVIPARTLKIQITTTAVDSDLTDGGDYGQGGTHVYPYEITLHGEDAAKFLDQVHIAGVSSRAQAASEVFTIEPTA